MSLKDYEVARDKFECDDAFSEFCFPCGACQHRGASSSEQPCLSCDHNANAKPDAEPVRYPVPGAPFDEPVEPVRECGNYAPPGPGWEPVVCRTCQRPDGVLLNWTAKGERG